MVELEHIADDLKIISDLTRLKIILLLINHKRLCVNAITCRLDVTQSAVSQHLRILRQGGFVDREKIAQQVHYSLNKVKLRELRTSLSDLMKD